MSIREICAATIRGAQVPLLRHRLLAHQARHPVVDARNHYFDWFVGRIKECSQRPRRCWRVRNRRTIEPDNYGGGEKARRKRPRQHSDPESGSELICDGRRIRQSPVLNGPKEGCVSPFRDLDDGWFFPAFSIEILVQLETQLSDMNPH